MPNPLTLYARFRTERHFYIYDTFSNAILQTPKPIWERIDQVLLEGSPAQGNSSEWATRTREAVADARSAGFLGPCDLTAMAFYESDSTLHTRLTRAISQLALEVTERCNLRCHYCAFANDERRNSHASEMSLATATKAISAFLSHSVEAKTRTVSFWGGEPLFALSLIRKVVDHVETCRAGAPISYAFTTNGTLIKEATARFLSAYKFQLLVSLDGPRHIHDRNRRGANGAGSFDDTLAGLRLLRTTDPEYYRDVRFNCVLSRDTSLDEVLQFFNTEPLVAGHDVTITAANRAGLPESDETTRFGGLTAKQREDARRMFLCHARKGTTPEAGGTLYASPLQRIALRSRAPLGDTVHPNGCCVPLLRKMVVRPTGDVYMCEQPPYLNPLGNIHTGLAFETAISMVREYAARSLPACRQCWAVRLCGRCYRDVMTDSRWTPAKDGDCGVRRETVRSQLAAYASVCEELPSGFDYLKSFVFSFPV